MPLKKNMTRDEIVDYLLNDLRRSVVDDVYPCIRPGDPRGGYFAVPKLVLSYVDYLGALYHGYDGRRNRQGRRIFAYHEYAKTFLRDIFGKVDPHYTEHGDLLWEIYRNGTIHLYEPMTLQNQGREIHWHAYKGPRIELLPKLIEGSQDMFWATHLVPHEVLQNRWVQPISITCLYEDLLASITLYARVIETDHNVEDRFRQTANALQTPEQTSRVRWW